MDTSPAIQTLQHTLLLSGIVDLYRDRVMLPGGVECDYTVMDYPPSVAIVPVTPDGSILLLRQYRYVLQDWSWELPGGIIDDGETPPLVALRELQEESGYSARRMELLAAVSFHPSQYLNARAYAHPSLCEDRRVIACRWRRSPSPVFSIDAVGKKVWLLVALV